MWMAKKVAVFIFYWKRKSIHKGKSAQSPLSQEKPLLNSVSEQDKGERGGIQAPAPALLTACSLLNGVYKRTGLQTVLSSLVEKQALPSTN